MKLLLDVNVVLDSLLAREPWRAVADAVWAACDAGQVPWAFQHTAGERGLSGRQASTASVTLDASRAV